MGDVASSLARPKLVRGRDGATFLVEGSRTRALPEHTLDALRRVLGPPVAAAGEELLASTTVPPPATDAADGSLAGMLDAHTPVGAAVAVAGSVQVDAPVPRTLHPLGPEPEGRGGPRVLDQLALLKARGVTHIVVPGSGSGWLDRWPNLADHLARQAAICAVGGAGGLWILSPPPPPGEPKIFGIGLNKTGTTSLHLACEVLGLRSFHWGDREAFEAVLQAQRDGTRILQYVGEEHDVYSDVETLSIRFDVADVQYPGSRFILTVRDVDSWIDSRRRHVERNRRNQLAGTYHGVNTRIDEGLWREQWERHLGRVRAHFEGRSDLLVLDIVGGDGWERLAPFLGRPIPDVPFPHGNADRPDEHAVMAPAATAPGAQSGSAARSTDRRGPVGKIERKAATAWRSVRRRLVDRSRTTD